MAQMREAAAGELDVLVVGSANTDFLVRAASLPRPGESVLGDSFQEEPGGKGANQAAAAVAARAGADERALTILLDALTAIGVLRKRDGAWQTEPSAAELLARDRPGSVLPMVLHSAQLWRRWGELTRLVAGPRPEEQADEASLRSFIGAMHVIAEPQAARIVSLAAPGGARRLLDVGGASGTYTLAFLAASPALRATLFDRPPVVEMARERIGRAGLLDRVTLVAGDFYEDPLPAGHDLVFVSAIIHQNTPDENVALFRQAFAALEPGGRLVIRDHVLSEDRTEPKSGALFAVNMLVAETGGELLHAGGDRGRPHRGRVHAGAAAAPRYADGRPRRGVQGGLRPERCGSSDDRKLRASSTDTRGANRARPHLPETTSRPRAAASSWARAMPPPCPCSTCFCCGSCSSRASSRREGPAA
jgi:predicted O-methyltransferase YrrM